MSEKKLYTIQIGYSSHNSIRIPVVCTQKQLEKIAWELIFGWKETHDEDCACVAAAGDWTDYDAFWRNYPKGVENYKFCDCM